MTLSSEATRSFDAERCVQISVRTNTNVQAMPVPDGAVDERQILSASRTQKLQSELIGSGREFHGTRTLTAHVTLSACI